MLDEFRIETTSVGQYIDKVEKKKIKADQDVQREFCWSNEMINNLIFSTISKKRIYIPNIILAEQNKEDGTKVTYIVDSEMLLPENENSMMAMLAWSEKEDKNIATWLQRFSVSHKTMPDMSQRERFEYMKKNCQKFEALQLRMKSA